MDVILSIETSTSVCSAALHEKGNLIAVKEVLTPQSAAAQLAMQVEELFTETNISKHQLKAVAVSSGPGSYTGLRIGVSTSKGICFGLNLPLISIDSLHVLASHAGLPSKTDFLCPMIDARRMEVYCSLLDPSFNILEETQAKVIDSDSYASHLELHSILFFGNGAPKCRETLKHPNAFFFDGAYTTAANMGKLAYKKFQALQFEIPGLLEPNYLKDFVAKTKLK